MRALIFPTKTREPGWNRQQSVQWSLELQGWGDMGMPNGLGYLHLLRLGLSGQGP